MILFFGNEFRFCFLSYILYHYCTYLLLTHLLLRHASCRSLIDTMFIFCAATAPTGGVLVGSWVVDELGGYCGNKQRGITLRVCTISGTHIYVFMYVYSMYVLIYYYYYDSIVFFHLGVFGCVFATLAVYTSDFYSFVTFLWLLLFFGGCILPAASGILLSIVPHKYRTVSSSFTLMICNIFGYFLSLCISGYIMEVRCSLVLYYILLIMHPLMVGGYMCCLANW
jgi:hypothetical protein